MGTESEQKSTLTMNDPVDPPTLKRMSELQTRRYQLGELMLDLEQEKVKILVEGRRLDEERQRLFANILGSRGLQPSVPVEIDPESGKINLLRMNGQPPPAAPVVEPTSAAPPATPNATGTAEPPQA